MKMGGGGERVLEGRDEVFGGVRGGGGESG